MFILNKIEAAEHGGTVTLRGEDAVATELAGSFSDTLSYPAQLSDIWEHLISQTRFVLNGTLPAGGGIVDSMPEWGEITLRRAASLIAQAAGCFVKVDREGSLEILACRQDGENAVDPDGYLTLTDGFQSYGPIDAVKVTPMDSEDAVTLGGGTGEPVEVTDNPIFQEGAAHLESLTENLLDALAGLTLTRADFTYRGDPAIGIGDRINLTDTYGKTLSVTLTRQTLRYENGFTAECACEIPDDSDAGILRAITPEGGVNADALVGTVNGGLLKAGSVTAKAIAARAITTEKLESGSVTADVLAAGCVQADKIAAGAVDALSVDAVTAAIDALSAGDVDANQLYAAFGHILSLAAASVSAGKITSDSVASPLAEFLNLYAQTGEFTFAQIENLLSSALILEKGVSDSMMIANLSVTSANLLSATVGNLILRSADGGYYRIEISSDGTIGAQEVTLTEDEIASGQTDSGNVIVSTGANIADLSAGTVKANDAILASILTESLTAGAITAGEALIASAAIPTLYAAAIKAIGDTSDLSANELVQILVGAQDTAARWFTFDNELGLIIRKPAYTDAEGIEHAASIWSTVTDETGYHIKRSDLAGYVGSFARDRLIVDGAQIGDIVARRTSGGGWAWVDG